MMSFALHGTTDGQRQLLEPKLLRVVATFTYVLVAMSDEWQHLMFDGRLLTHRGLWPLVILMCRMVKLRGPMVSLV